MTINKKTLGIICLFVGIILLIVGIFGFNASSMATGMVYLVYISLPGVIILIVGIILLALYLHSVT